MASALACNSSAVGALISVASQPWGSRGGQAAWPSLTRTPTLFVDMARRAASSVQASLLLRMRSPIVWRRVAEAQRRVIMFLHLASPTLDGDSFHQAKQKGLFYTP